MKKAIIIILAVIIVLLPTIAALILHFMPDSSISNPINISGHLSDGDKVEFEFNRNTNTPLASFFDQLYENSLPTELTTDKLNFDKEFGVDTVKRNVTKHLTLYLSVTRPCYFDDNGTVYQINTDYANTLLNSKYAISLYEELYTPKLITFSNDTVTPSSTQYKYVMKGGDSIERNNAEVTSKAVTYYSSNTSYFEFSTNPTYGTVTVTFGDTVIPNIPLYEFDPSVLPKNTLVKFEIDATWVKKATSNVMGTASYEFYIDYSPAPSFTVDKKEATAGDFLVVTASNVLDPGKISCSFSAGLTKGPEFFKNGNDYVALIPIDMDTKASYYRLTLECGETKKVHNVTVKARSKSTSENIYEISSPLTEEMLTNMNSLISSVGLRYSEDKYSTGTFYNYDNVSDELQLMLNYGRTREFSTGLPFRMIGIEFLSFYEVNVPAINGGIVCAIGTDAVLGNYIVIDHGFGLKSWYCNVDNITLAVGDTVAKGDYVATTGQSAFYEKQGVFLITTVLDVPVYPYALMDNKFELPK